MGIRKSLDSPKTPKRSMRQKQRQRSNLGSSSACRKSHSSHTPTKRVKSARNHLLVSDIITRAKIQDAHEFAVAKGLYYEDKHIFAQFGVKNRIEYRYLNEFARTSQGGVKQRERKPKLSEADVFVANSLLEDSSLDMEAKGMQRHALV